MGLKLGRASLRMTCASPDRSSLVWIAPFLLRDLRQDYPGTCGGYALAVRAAHFLATSAVTADALPFTHPTAMQTNPTSALNTPIRRIRSACCARAASGHAAAAPPK
jgi:hypothetical protein